MSAKLYREVIKFLKNQKNVLKTFENDRSYIIHNNPDVRKFIDSLIYNLNLLEKNINNCIDDKEE